MYVKHSLGFEDSIHPDYVFKLKKSLYGLKQALRAWYEGLSNFMLENGFQKRKVDITLFRKTHKNYILIVQVYVNDINFGSTNAFLFHEFSRTVLAQLEMSLMVELNFFLGIQINQWKEGVYVHQTKCIKEPLKNFKLDYCKIMSTHMHPTRDMSKEENITKVFQKLYRDMIGSFFI